MRRNRNRNRNRALRVGIPLAFFPRRDYTFPEKGSWLKEPFLYRSLEDGAVLESSLRADADHARSRARALQDEIAALQRALAGRNEEDTAAEVRHQLEVQGLRKELEGARSEGEEKGAQLEACEQVNIRNFHADCRIFRWRNCV